MILYRCGLLSHESHIDQLGYEKRLLVDQNGSLYTGYCTTFIPRSVNRLADRIEKLRLFCELICGRLIAAATETGHLEAPHSIYLASEVDIQARIHTGDSSMNLLYFSTLRKISFRCFFRRGRAYFIGHPSCIFSFLVVDRLLEKNSLISLVYESVLLVRTDIRWWTSICSEAL